MTSCTSSVPPPSASTARRAAASSASGPHASRRRATRPAPAAGTRARRARPVRPPREPSRPTRSPGVPGPQQAPRPARSRTVTRSANPVASTTARRNRAFLAIGSTQGERRRRAWPRPGADPGSRRPSRDPGPARAPAAQPRERREAVEDMRGRDRRPVPDGRQVDVAASTPAAGARGRRSPLGRRDRVEDRRPAPGSTRPRSRASAYDGRQRRGVLDARRERLALRSTARLLWFACHRSRGAAPGVDSSRTVGAGSVFRYPSGSRPGFPKPLVDRVTLAFAPVREGTVRAERWARQRGYPRTARRGARDSWISRPSAREPAGRVARAGAAERSSARRRSDPIRRRSRSRSATSASVAAAPARSRASVRRWSVSWSSAARLATAIAAAGIAPAGPGSTSTKLEPTPSRLATSSSPPIARARSRAIGRPRPVPVIAS